MALLPAGVADRLQRVFDLKVLGFTEPWACRQYRLAVRDQPVLPTAVQRFIDALGVPAEAAPAASISLS